MQSAGFWNRSWSIFKQACALPLIGLVKFYQLCISPFTPPSCRFTPTGPLLPKSRVTICF